MTNKKTGNSKSKNNSNGRSFDFAFRYKAVSGFGWNDGLVAGEGKRFALCANAHLSDDKTVAKRGHPVSVG